MQREASHEAAISRGWIGPDLLGWNALVSLQRQGELKDGAPGFIRARPHPSPVSLDHRPADSEAHAHALGLCRVEGLEYALDICRVQAGAGIANRDAYAAGGLRLGGDPEFARRLADAAHGFNGIEDQVQ